MAKIIIDETIRAILDQIFYPVEFCDPSGKILGRFIPTADFSRYEPVTPETDKKELERRKHSTEKRYTTAEVLAHLRNCEIQG